MKGRITVLLSIVALFFFPDAHAQTKDSLFLKGGQVLIGELKGFLLGKVEFDDDVVRVVTIKSSNIKTMKASLHLFQLETIYYDLYYTTVRPAQEGMVLINKDGQWQEISIEEISQIMPLKRKTGGLWSGNVTAGYTFTRSSDIGRFNADLELRWATRKFEVLTKGSLITTKTDSTSEIENASLPTYQAC